MSAKDKHSSLLEAFVNYECKKFYVFVTSEANVIKLFLSVI
jgi:hypothetical protein